MSYNLLADSLFEEQAGHLMSDDPVHDLQYRNQRILAEIENSSPDILCLQEVSHGPTLDFFMSELEQLGYQIA